MRSSIHNEPRRPLELKLLQAGWLLPRSLQSLLAWLPCHPQPPHPHPRPRHRSLQRPNRAAAMPPATAATISPMRRRWRQRCRVANQEMPPTTTAVRRQQPTNRRSPRLRLACGWLLQSATCSLKLFLGLESGFFFRQRATCWRLLGVFGRQGVATA